MGLPIVPQPYMVTQVPTWASIGPGESGPYLFLPGTGNSGHHLGITGLVNLVPIWVSPRSGDFVPHLDLIAVNSLLASPATGDSDSIWASPRSGDSGPHLGIIGTW